VLALSTLGLLTHPALDWMNTYGMRWWLPFDGRWSYGDALFIIDPWIWLALGGAVFLAYMPGRGGTRAWAALAALATAAVAYGAGLAALLPWGLGLGAIVALRRSGTDDGPRHARRARWALAAVVAYIALMVVQDPIAVHAVRAAAEAAGLEVEDVMVAPVPGNPLRADIEVVTPDAVVPGTHRWLPPSVSLDAARGVGRLATPPTLPDATAAAVVEAARAHPDVRRFLTWSRYPLVTVTPSETGWNVRFTDARYDDRRAAGSLAGLTVVVPQTAIR
jgi:inner membrane protein